MLLFNNIIIKYFNVSENEKKICRQVEKINSIPSIDSWLIKFQQNLFTKNTGSEINTQNIQLNHQYKDLPSLMPIVNIEQLNTIALNTWS